MAHEIHNNIKFSRAISPIAAVTNDTAFVSQILDMANFEHNEFVGIMGSIADANVTFTLLVEDGNDAALADAAAVADDFLLGTEAGTVTSGAAASGGAPGFADDNKTFKIGYTGLKRYLRVTLTPASNTGDIFCAAVFAQSGARKTPLSTQVN